MADKSTVTVYPPGGGPPVEAQPHNVAHYERIGWSTKRAKPSKRRRDAGAQEEGD